MSRIIPAILTENAKILKQRVELVAPFVELAQIDVMDGKFVPEKSVSDPEVIAKMHLPISWEAHLMIEEPEKYVESWIKAGAARIILHAEAQGNLGLAIEKTKKFGRKIGIAFNPSTELQTHEDLFNLIDFVQFMGVIPGAMGKEFHNSVFDKIASFKKNYKNLLISVDGGVSDENIRQLARVGVNDLVVGSAVFHSPNPKEALQKFLNILKVNK